MGDARRCTATSKRSGKRCRANVYRKPEGGYTKTCRFHRGGVELTEPGDPTRGGRPPSSHLHTRHLTDDQLEAFEHARGRSPVDRMEDLVAFAHAQLDAYLAKHSLAVEGGQLVSKTSGAVDSDTWELHVRIIHAHVETIRKAEKDLAAIRDAGGGGGEGDATEDYVSWIKRARSKSRRRSS